jgi:hypothetical protein
MLDRRRGRLYLHSYNKKKKLSEFFWLKEEGFDVDASEKVTRQRDSSEKAWKVIGTGAVLAKMERL